MHCGKKWWIREFVAPYIFPLNPDYVAARSLRSLRSNYYYYYYYYYYFITFTFLSLSWRVAEHSDSNKMDAHNLAVVFGPTLFRIPSEQDMIAYQSQVNGMIELLIKHSGEVFPGSGESLREKLSDTEDGSDSEEGMNVEFL